MKFSHYSKIALIHFGSLLVLVNTLGGINLKTNGELCLKKMLIDDIDRILNNILLFGKVFLI